jgi:hypothetical protein
MEKNSRGQERSWTTVNVDVDVLDVKLWFGSQ